MSPEGDARVLCRNKPSEKPIHLSANEMPPCTLRSASDRPRKCGNATNPATAAFIRSTKRQPE
ncbi:hypothetical protein [Kingella potus]|uniref:hypothetical protein n=1 Tax=Kingella potus TaxID=265175 RepID=UPI001FD3BAE1|nr:hypothetical protein [Kingella potus]UOP01036.1 hypothetical protein LVJ84_01255 [Kingella potus]